MLGDGWEECFSLSLSSFFYFFFQLISCYISYLKQFLLVFYNDYPWFTKILKLELKTTYTDEKVNLQLPEDWCMCMGSEFCSYTHSPHLPCWLNLCTYWPYHHVWSFTVIHLYCDRGVMVIVVGNGHGYTSSNPGRDWLHFT